MTFKEKVQSMSFKEILAAMIDGLENPVTEIDMSVYGQKIAGVCFGCAATNACMRIARVEKLPKNVGDFYQQDRLSIMNEIINSKNKEFLDTFERAINELRCSKIHEYNYLAKLGRFAECPNLKAREEFELMTLTTRGWPQEIHNYKRFLISL